MMRTSMIAALIVLATAIASAQPGTQPAAADRPTKSEATARRLAIGASAVGIGALVVGSLEHSDGLVVPGMILTVVGPSFGHFYADDFGHAVLTSLVRGAGLVTFVFGAVRAESTSCVDSCDEHRSGQRTMLLGGVVVLGTTIYDIVDAGGAARRFNERGGTTMVAPTLTSANGHSTLGLAVSGRF